MLDKKKRIRCRKAIEEARKAYCEYCFRHTHCDGRNVGQVHHIKSKGSGGDDVPENLIHLCYACHRRVHDGKIPREDLINIVRRR